MELIVGEYVTITLKDGREFSGLVLPNNTLKLDDGYNIGINPQNITDMKTQQQTPETASPPEITRDDSKPRVDILHTGGTIASKVDYKTGGVHNHIKPDELLGMYPQLQENAAVYATFVANMSSDDMRFAHYNLLIDAVHQALKNNPKGIIITHGTDTLHYTSAALHYALRGIDVPVLIVGSQRSSDRGSSDAATNLQAAVTYIVSEQAVPGVYVAMHETNSDTSISIIHGAHARKNHSSRRDAFKAINSSPIARVTDTVEVLRKVEKSSAEFCASHFNTDLKIGMLYAHPNMHAQEVQAYNDFDGLIVLGTGLGHLPITAYDEHTSEHKNIFEALKNLSCPIVMSSQCLNGRVNLQVYSPARKLQEIGVLGHDVALTPEALFIKLAYLLSTQQEPHSIAADMDDSIDRTAEESYE